VNSLNLNIRNMHKLVQRLTSHIKPILRGYSHIHDVHVTQQLSVFISFCSFAEFYISLRFVKLPSSNKQHSLRHNDVMFCLQNTNYELCRSHSKKNVLLKILG